MHISKLLIFFKPPYRVVKTFKGVANKLVAGFCHSLFQLTRALFGLQITATDQRCAGDTRVKIHVMDINDNAPGFDERDYYVDINEVCS